MRRYDVLAEALARTFEGRLEAIKEAGRSFGRGLARPGATSALGALEPLLEMGGDYEPARGGTLVCTNCLFADVCRRVPSICTFHAGAIEGLMHGDGSRSRVEALGSHGPGGCAYEVG
jgi:predicted ArsR family transcriptional regulator